MILNIFKLIKSVVAIIENIDNTMDRKVITEREL